LQLSSSNTTQNLLDALSVDDKVDGVVVAADARGVLVKLSEHVVGRAAVRDLTDDFIQPERVPTAYPRGMKVVARVLAIDRGMIVCVCACVCVCVCACLLKKKKNN
jgi:ribosomal protein S1